MKNIMNQKGFTLIEMLIVLLIISVLILITVPNLTKHNDTVDEKGCEAYKKIVSSQVQLYKLENQEFPTIDQLVDSAYIEQFFLSEWFSIIHQQNDGRSNRSK